MGLTGALKWQEEVWVARCGLGLLYLPVSVAARAGQSSDWLFLPGGWWGRKPEHKKLAVKLGPGENVIFQQKFEFSGKIKLDTILILRSLHLIYFYRHDSYLFQPSQQGYSDFFVRLLYRLVTFLKKNFFFLHMIWNIGMQAYFEKELILSVFPPI